jgi:hypothetical protein
MGTQFNCAPHHELFQVVRPHLLDVIEGDSHSFHIRSDEIANRVNGRFAIFVDEGFELGQLEVGNQTDTAPSVDGSREQLETANIVVGVQALTSVASTRRDDSIPAFPRAENGSGETGSLRDDANRMAGFG